MAGNRSRASITSSMSGVALIAFARHEARDDGLEGGQSRKATPGARR